MGALYVPCAGPVLAAIAVAGTLHQIVGNPGDTARHDQLDMQGSKGLQVFSFTFG